MTRKQFAMLTRESALRWIVPPECQGQIVLRKYASDDEGRYWKAVDDRSRPDDHPDAVEVWRADATNPRDVSYGAVFEPWNEEPRGIRWHKVTEP